MDNENQEQQLSSLTVEETSQNGVLASLKTGDTLLVAARGVKGGKVQLEFAEHINNPTLTGTSNPLLSMLNASDPRFTQRGPRRAWISGEKKEIKAIFGINVDDIAEGVVKELNVLNPVIGDQRVRVQVLETTKPDAYQAANIDLTAKRNGREGEFLLHNGMYVFSNTRVIISQGEVKNTFLPSDAPAEGAEGIKATTATVEATVLSQKANQLAV